MGKTAISTEVNLAHKFFTALGRDDDEEVICMFKSTSFDNAGM